MTTLPGTDIPVPSIAVGTMFWGIDNDDATAHAIIDRAIDHDVAFLDTANNYAFWRDGGTGDESEQVVGRWVATHDRDRVTLATKLGARPRFPGGGTSDGLGLRPEASRAQLEDSLRRLQTDHVDLLYAHIDDHDVPLDEAIGGLQQLVTDGLTRAIAASNLTADRLREAVAIGGYSALQNRLSYLRPSPDADFGVQVLLDSDVENVARQNGIVLFGYSTLLAGSYTRNDRPLPPEYDTPANGAALASLRAVAADAGIDAGQTVLAWLTQREPAVVPIVGVSRVEHLEDALTAVGTRLDPAAVARLEAARAG